MAPRKQFSCDMAPVFWTVAVLSALFLPATVHGGAYELKYDSLNNILTGPLVRNYGSPVTLSPGDVMTPKEIEIGGIHGWAFTTDAFVGWLKTVTIHVGDTLVFNYDGLLFDVGLLTSKPAYDECFCVGAKMLPNKAGKSTYLVKSSRPLYFVSTLEGHCRSGLLKIAIYPRAAFVRPESQWFLTSAWNPTNGAYLAPDPAPLSGPGKVILTHAASRNCLSLPLTYQAAKANSPVLLHCNASDPRQVWTIEVQAARGYGGSGLGMQWAIGASYAGGRSKFYLGVDKDAVRLFADKTARQFWRGKFVPVQTRGAFSLGPGEYLSKGQAILARGGRFGALVDFRGDLVLYDYLKKWVYWRANARSPTNTAYAIFKRNGQIFLCSSYPCIKPYWKTTKTCRRPNRLVIQDDGNLVAYATSGINSPFWDAGKTGMVTTVGGGICQGRMLCYGQQLVSPSGQCHLVFQVDGNLVLYDAKDPYAAPSPSGALPEDSLSKIKAKSYVTWATNTANLGPQCLRIDDMGAVRMYASDNFQTALSTMWPNTPPATTNLVLDDGEHAGRVLLYFPEYNSLSVSKTFP